MPLLTIAPRQDDGTMTKTKTWSRVVGLAGVALISLGMGTAARAVEDEVVTTPIVDFENYPPALPAACPGGPAALIDARFDNGRGAQGQSFADLDVRGGDTVTLSWAGLADGCEDGDGNPLVSVSLAAYETEQFDFDPALDQRLLPGWVTAGAGATPFARVGDRWSVSFVVPGEDVSCLMQIDAVLGAPLAVVGPSGSFYSRVLRGDDRPDMLIGSKALETIPCVPAPTTTSTAPPAVAPQQLAATTTTTAAEVLAAQATVPPQPAVLPVTGTTTTSTVVLALTLLAGGAALLGTAYRLRPAAQHS